MAFRHSAPLSCYRIADARLPIFDGAGAAIHGARWNSPGRRVIYAAGTYACALLEKLVHTNIGRVPRSQSYIEILIPKDVAVEVVDVRDVPGWNAEDQEASRAYGDAWYDEGRTAVLVVPSAVAPIEHVVAINQMHGDFRKITASEPGPVLWDERLFLRKAD